MSDNQAHEEPTKILVERAHLDDMHHIYESLLQYIPASTNADEHIITQAFQSLSEKKNVPARLFNTQAIALSTLCKESLLDHIQMPMFLFSRWPQRSMPQWMPYGELNAQGELIDNSATFFLANPPYYILYTPAVKRTVSDLDTAPQVRALIVHFEQETPQGIYSESIFVVTENEKIVFTGFMERPLPNKKGEVLAHSGNLLISRPK